MKKKNIIALMLIAAMALSATACGGAEDTSSDADYEEAEVEDADYGDEAADDGAAADDSVPSDAEFTLLDVSADMISSGLYAKDEENSELVFSLFTTPAGTNMVSLFIFAEDGSGDVFCGAYDAEVVPDENTDGVTWTNMSFTDVYTGTDMVLSVVEADDNSVCITNPAGSIYEAQYLSADETINYMGAAVALLG